MKRTSRIGARGHGALIGAIISALTNVVSAQTCVQITQQEETRVCPSGDQDCDGISDATEHVLLQRYRPYLLFAKDEDYLPTSVADYIRQSEVLTDGDEDGDDNMAAQHGVMQGNIDTPIGLYTAGSDFCWSGASPGQSCSSDLRQNPKLSRLHINPLERVPGIARKNPGRHGAASWRQALPTGNIGLYGHVSLVRFPREGGRPHLPETCTADGTTTSEWWNAVTYSRGDIYYKVEYWQFFGYNEPHAAGLRVHEGDWTSVQLIVKAPPAFVNVDGLTAGGGPKARIILEKTITSEDAFPTEVIAVMHFTHGLELRYRLDRPVSKTIVSNLVIEYQGRNAGKDDDIEWSGISNPGQCGSDVPNLQDNAVRFVKDFESSRFTHPMVYVERGAHEFWPTERWAYRGAPAHWGDGTRYLAGTVPNLGEFAHPLKETQEANVILHFNGRWGAHRQDNDPPQGPTLHGQWNFPNDAIRLCLIQGGAGGY